MKLVISLREQTLCLLDAHDVVQRRYSVSTARNGPGERIGSYCTPRGRHRIRAKIGRGMPLGTVFKGRRPTGEIYSVALAQAAPQRDWILTRILWLCGEECGFNRLGDVDTMRRYIYIHGAPDNGAFGQPDSHGCIRMRNRDVAELFELVSAGTAVEVRADPTVGDVRVIVTDWARASRDATSIRDRVFVQEQGVPAELEHDPADADNHHALAWIGNVAVGTGRLKPDGHIGRMAVLPDYRRYGIGRALLEALISEARNCGLTKAMLNAQTSAIDFYAALGFSAKGDRFMEAGIEHQAMQRELQDEISLQP